MRRWSEFVALAAVLLSFPAAHAQSSGACVTTAAPDEPFVPPAPYWQHAAEGTFWYGTEPLWTALSSDGIWRGLHNENGYRNKLFFWSKGYDWKKEPKPRLIITAKRLDGDAPDVAIDDASNALAPSSEAAGMVTAFELPTEGCWELTAHYHGHGLTFVVLVKP